MAMQFIAHHMINFPNVEIIVLFSFSCERFSKLKVVVRRRDKNYSQPFIVNQRLTKQVGMYHMRVLRLLCL